MKLNHSELLDLTTEALQEDLSRRVRESVGAPVLYPHETVQALLTQVENMEKNALCAQLFMAELAKDLPNIRVEPTRAVFRNMLLRVNSYLVKVTGQTPSALHKSEEW